MTDYEFDSLCHASAWHNVNGGAAIRPRKEIYETIEQRVAGAGLPVLAAGFVVYWLVRPSRKAE